MTAKTAARPKSSPRKAAPSKTQRAKAAPASAAGQAYDGPPDYRVVGQHDVFPAVTHDEAARYNFIAHLNRHLSTKVLPGVMKAYETRVEPAHRAAKKRPFKDRHEVRKALLKDPMFQWWSALRRSTMEMRQQAGRWVALRQADALSAAVAELTSGDPRLVLNPAVKPPRYIAAVDHHIMPGSYYTELRPGDVTVAASYDSGLFCTTGGMLGRFSDGGGQAVVNWARSAMPDFAPKTIVDLGCTLGHNVLPIAQAFPDADVLAIDVGAPMLRYGLARAKAMGVDNVTFMQADVEDLSMIEDESVDWVQTTMFLHETSHKAMKNIFAEALRILKPGGVMVHVEQPQYADGMPLIEQAMRDWDAFYNNEPFWSKLHEIDIDDFMVTVGFKKKDLIHGRAVALVDKEVFPDAADDDSEDFGRKAAWEVFGARKAAPKAKKSPAKAEEIA